MAPMKLRSASESSMMRPRGERPDYTGMDVIIVRGDKIAPLYVQLPTPRHGV